MRDRISPERQSLYYLGIGISLVGVLLFLSNFFVGFSGHIGDDFPGRSDFGRGFDSFGRGMMIRGIGGMILITVGQFISRIGSHGLAGSGVVLDPKRARKDLEPYSRMKGGMLGDAIDESGLIEELKNSKDSSRPVIMIRCRNCEQLNEEDSKFCQECGRRV